MLTTDQNRGLNYESLADFVVRFYRNDPELRKGVNKEIIYTLDELSSLKCKFCGGDLPSINRECVLRMFIHPDDKMTASHGDCVPYDNSPLWFEVKNYPVPILGYEKIFNNFIKTNKMERPYGTLTKDATNSIHWTYNNNNFSGQKLSSAALVSIDALSKTVMTNGSYNKSLRDKLETATERQENAIGWAVSGNFLVDGLLLANHMHPWTLMIFILLSSIAPIIGFTAQRNHLLKSPDPYEMQLSASGFVIDATKEQEVANYAQRVANLALYWDITGDDNVRYVTTPFLQNFAKLSVDKDITSSSTLVNTILWEWSLRLLLDCIIESKDTERKQETLAWAESFVDGFFDEIETSDNHEVLETLLKVRSTIRELPKVEELTTTQEMATSAFEVKKYEAENFVKSLNDSH